MTRSTLTNERSLTRDRPRRWNGALVLRGPQPSVGVRWLAWLLLALLVGSGCAGTSWVRMRRRPETPIAAELNLFSWRGPMPTPRTQQLLRRLDLVETMERNPREVVEQLLACENPEAEHVCAVAEVAFIAAKLAENRDQIPEALDCFSISVAQAYMYLLSDELADARNPYDPRFRQASDLYNGALEGALRIAQRRGEFRPGHALHLETASHQYALQIECVGPHHEDDIAELKFVSDFELQGLRNHYRTFGLGVPLIAVQNRAAGHSPAEPYYAPGMSFPVTAFLRVLNPDAIVRRQGDCLEHRCVLELHDPLVSTDILVNQRLVPLETDLSTPLAYSLNDPAFQRANVAIRGLLNLQGAENQQRLFLLEPYDPNKIPVLMIHGLWSNLITWMEMFNDLRGVTEIRDRYQFWFYLYPTGQPFLLTAAQLRSDLEAARQVLDPTNSSPAMQQAVLVGHSMGGLIARLQTLESGDRFRALVGDVADGARPMEQGDRGRLRKEIEEAIYFHPNPAVRCVITIASPHHGSSLSNSATQWLGRRLIRVPDVLLHPQVPRMGGEAARKTDDGSWKIQTSIDALSPASPLLEIMQEAPSAPWVEYYNIVGRVKTQRVWSHVAKESDGVVSLASAHLEGAVSELVVEADHVNIHRHPRTVLEVQRILLQHLDEIDAQGSLPANRSLPAYPRKPE